VLLPVSGEAVGIDLGIESFASLSNFERIENPKFFEQSQRELRKAQHRVARRKLRLHRRRKAVRLLQKVHERIRNRRLDLHKQSTNLIQRFGTIVVEDLNIKGLAGGILASKYQTQAGHRSFKCSLTKR
jgi:putative transposase